MNYGYSAQEVSEGKNVSNKSRDNSYDILTKTVAFFWLCPKILPEAKLKCFGLMILSEEISRQHDIDTVLWLLLVTHIQNYNKKKSLSLTPP